MGSRGGVIQCDYTIPEPVRNTFENVGEFDALISVMGRNRVFEPLVGLDDDDYMYRFAGCYRITDTR